MRKKEIVLDIAQELYLKKNKQNKKYLHIKSNTQYQKLKKNYLKYNNIFYAIIDFKKFKLFDVLSIYFFIRKNYEVYNNFLIFFDLKNEIIAHNFFPDWPAKYKFSNILKNLFFWLKLTLYNFIFFKKIAFILIKFK